jgi:outer membrane protein OmpA-like peptidoglycan-associated protein
MRPWLAALLLLQSSGPALPLQPAVQYITAAFASHPLVAFSEPGHGSAGTKEFFAALIRHPGFAGTVTDIVIECGNARYQAVADRYFSGQVVQRDELRRIWENTTIVSGVWQLPMYEDILADIRAVNLTRPADQRIRVLLGDPPIDWATVRGPADEDMNDWRDAHFAWVVEEQVLKKGRRALLWIGGAHISRGVILPDSLIHLLDRRFPNRTHVVHGLDADRVAVPVKDRLGTWPSLSAARVRHTWLGGLDVREVGHSLSRGPVEADVDAVIFWDVVQPAADAARRTGLPAEELKRRQQLAQATLPFRGGQIRFEADRASLTAASEPALHAVLEELRRDTRLTLLVKAFTDAREADGPRLSRQRAARVVAWLTERGIEPSRLEARGCAAARALWIGVSEEQRAANRRAELVRRSNQAGCVPPASFDVRE